MTNMLIITLVPLLPKVRSQSLLPVRQFTTAHSNYATASQCDFYFIIYLTLEESYSKSIDIRQSKLLQSISPGVPKGRVQGREIPPKEILLQLPGDEIVILT